MIHFVRKLYCRFQKSSIVLKFFIVNMLFMLLLSSLLIFNHNYLKETAQSQMVHANETFLKQFSTHFTIDWQTIKIAVYKLSVAIDTKMFLSNIEEYSGYYIDLNKYKEKLAEINLQLPFEAQTTVYFPNKNMMISSNGTSSSDVYYKSLATKNNEETCKCFHENTETENIYVLSKSVIYTYKIFPKGTVIVQINKADLLNYLNDATVLLNNEIVIFDQYKDVVVSTTALDQQKSEGLFAANTLSSNLAKKGKYYTPEQETNGLFSYSVLIPGNAFKESLKQARNYSIVLFAIFTFANIGFAVVNMSMFQPLRRIAKTIRRAVTLQHTNNEYTIITDSFNELSFTTGSMQQEIDAQSNIIEQHALLHLLTDQRANIKPNIFRSLQLSFDQYIMVTLMKHNGTIESLSPASAILKQLFSDYGQSYLLPVHSNSLVFIVRCTGNDLQSFKQHIEQVLLKHAESTPGAVLLCGLSRVYSNLEQISEANKEARKAILKHPVNYNVSVQVLLFKHWYTDVEPIIQLPMDKEQELVNYTLKGNESEIKHFFEKNLLHQQDLTYEQASNMLRYLYDLLHVIMNSRKIEANEVWSKYQVTQGLQILQEYNRILNGYLFVAERCELPNAVLLEQVEDYINKNYANPNLSLTYIADHFSITHVYLSMYFKKHSSINFIHYLHKVRIEKAIKIIESQPDMTMKDVAEQVGYTTVGTFIRHFKKISGTTPAQHNKYQVEE